MSEVPSAPPGLDRTTEIAEEADAARRRAWYQKKRFLLPIVSVLAFLFGVAAGLGDEGAPLEQAADLRGLQDEVTSLNGQVSDLEDEREELEEQRDQLRDESTQDDELDLQMAQLEKEVANLEDQVVAVRGQRDALSGENQERAERIRQLEAQLAAQQPAGPAPGTQSSPSQPRSGPSVYYENCDAARAAGAAPLRRGDPGYASHLDGDNDGVACE